MCKFCEGQCSCHTNPLCGFCTSHIECNVCGQLVCNNKVEEGKDIMCPDCCDMRGQNDFNTNGNN